MIEILIADDHAIVRRGIQEIIAENEDMVVASEATNVQELIDQVSTRHYDVVVTDLSMPGKSVLDAIRDLKRDHPKLRILVLTMHSEESYALRAFKAGADGYLTKESVPEQLVNAIRRVHGGRKFVSPSIAEMLVGNLDADADRPSHERLSDREYMVMSRLASGMRIKDIATEMSLSAKTITTYRTRILEKMNLKSNAELAAYALQHELIIK